MKIDVIIPAYKAQSTIAKTIASIVCQTIAEDIKITIVNDADGIGYGQVVKDFSNYIDIQELVMPVNGGPGVARQYGIDHTKNPLVTCIDADDTFAGAFALEILCTAAVKNPEYTTFIGTFVEDQQELRFNAHPNDMIWMFGKMYRRAFLDKYKIRFNETRANEDNGFNTIIRLVSSEQEKIMFLPDNVYYWHYKEDSITRVNNAQYSYDGSFVGYTDNMIYAIKHAQKVKPFSEYINIWAIQVMMQLYLYYYQTVKRDPRFTQQNYRCCVKYYQEVFRHYHDTMPTESFVPIFAETNAQQAPLNQDNVPELTIFQFIDKLRHDNDTLQQPDPADQ